MQSLLLNISGQRNIGFTQAAFFTLWLKHSPMTAAGTTASEKLFEPNCALSEFLIHNWNFCGHLFCTTPPQHSGSPSLVSISIIIHWEPLQSFFSHTALTLAPLAPSSKIYLKIGNSHLHTLGPHVMSSAELLTELPAPDTEHPLFKSILKMQQHLPRKLSFTKSKS